MTSNSYQIQISNTLAPTVTPLMLAISSENSSNSSVGQSGPTGSVGQSGPIGPIGPIGPTGPPLSMLITSVYNTSGSPPEIRVNQIYIYTLIDKVLIQFLHILLLKLQILMTQTHPLITKFLQLRHIQRHRHMLFLQHLQMG